jgi:hypothetical protein
LLKALTWPGWIRTGDDEPHLETCSIWWETVSISLAIVCCWSWDCSIVGGNDWNWWTRNIDVVVGGIFIFVSSNFDDRDVLFVSDAIELILLQFDSFVFSIISGTNDPIDVTAEIPLSFFVYSKDKGLTVELDSK